MADQRFLNDNAAINFPLESSDEATSQLYEIPPPCYEQPQIEFNSGWKDRGFAIAFWIHMVAIIVISIVLGMPILLPFVKNNIYSKHERTSFDSNIRVFICALGGATAISGLLSFIIFFLLQICAGAIIMCSLIIIIVIEILACVFFLFMLLLVPCIAAFIFLLATIMVICVIRKRIEFYEVHLRVGCAVLRQHPSLIFVALVIFVVVVVWIVLWCLMVLGIFRVSNISPLNDNDNTAITNTNSVKEFAVSDTKPALINKPLDMINNTTANSTPRSKRIIRQAVGLLIAFVLLIVLFWEALIFVHVVHFITACTVGQWWFTNDTGQQYSIKTSVTRALTTNFGTICFGSLLEGLIRPARWNTSGLTRRNRDASCRLLCARRIFKIPKNLFDYFNEWTFIYAALTGQSCIKATQSTFELFEKRGWNKVTDNSIMEICLAVVDFVVGLVSAATGGLLVYMLISDLSEEHFIIMVMVVIISFLIGIILSTMVTTILSSCARAVFVCFALNPAALTATHPDHLQNLTEVWQKYYPEEFVTSGYANSLPNPVAADSV